MKRICRFHRLVAENARISASAAMCSWLLACVSCLGTAVHAGSFDFKRQLFGDPSTLGFSVLSIDTGTGEVCFNGGDSQCPTTPFTWDWGDGQVNPGWFPQRHAYADTLRNYVVTLTSHYADGGTNTAQCVARFVPPEVTPVALPGSAAVTIPSEDVTLEHGRMPSYVPPSTLSHFDEDDFGVVPRGTIEYILTAGASIQLGFVNHDTYTDESDFHQVLLRDVLLAGGMYSLWYTDPIAFGVSSGDVRGTIGYSSLLHEMGHNVTLNFPAACYYGGKIDGCANTIYSESMAQVFQHATAHVLINHAEAYGLSDDLAVELAQSTISSMNVVRNAYDAYVAAGCPFASWNDPTTPEDETFGTFMTIAYKFFECAENGEEGYGPPATRMMDVLRLFDETYRALYDQHHDTPEAGAFRATLMVASLSHAFSTDLRPDFSDLNFPIDDAIYADLLDAVAEAMPGDANGDGKVDDLDASILATNWLKPSGATWSEADFNDDGVVNDLDASILAANWQAGVGSAVPEPGGWALLVGLAVVLLARRVRRERLNDD